MKSSVRERENSSERAAGAASYVIAAALVLAAAFLMCSLLWTAVSFGAPSQGGFAAPGRFLYSVYGVTSFFVPAFLLACAILLLLQDAPFPLYFLLLTSLIPFFTAFGGEKLIHALTPSGAPMLSKLVFFVLIAAVMLAVVVEFIMLFQIARRIERRAASKGVDQQEERLEESEELDEDAANIKEEKAEERAPASFEPQEESGPAQESASDAAQLNKVSVKINDESPNLNEAAGDFLPLSSAKDEAFENAGAFERAGGAGNININISILGGKEDVAAESAAAESAAAESAVADSAAGESAVADSAAAESAITDVCLKSPPLPKEEPKEEAQEAIGACADEGAPAALNGEEAFELDAESEEALALYEAEEDEVEAESAVEAASDPIEEMTAEDVASLIPDVDFDPAMFDGYIAGNFSVLDEEEAVALEEMDESPLFEGFAPTAKDFVDFASAAEEFDDLAANDEAEQEESEHEEVAPKAAQEAVQAAVPAAKETASPSASTSWARLKYHIACDILTTYPDGEYWVIDEDTKKAAAILKDTLNEFRIQADVTGIRKGPVITMFEILPAPGVKLSKIVGLQDNIALRLAASSVRIVAPIPGKHAVGIEVPNKKRAIVSFRELIETDSPASRKMAIPVMLGKDIAGEAQIVDLAATPHLLIAGSTGSGKSVCVNSIILSILYKRTPAEVKLILIDPKVVELKLYNDIGHLLAPVITEPKKAFQALQYCLCEMERRYAVLDGMGVRNIKEYNKRIEERGIAAEPLPYIVVIIDEFADLMATTGKELESTVARLAAMSRAVGIHLVLATQRPSIDVITGLIKANIPSRIAFMVASKTDSRIIIDQVGAEKLLGKGDMLYSSVTDPFPVRIQGAFVSDEEVERVVEQVKSFGAPEYIDDEIFVDDDDDDALDSSFFRDGEDPLYDKALDIVLSAGKASASYIQRRLKIGYNRAARLVEDMEARGIVGPANGSKAREVIHVPDRAS